MGPCMKPWPLNPAMTKRPSTSGTEAHDTGLVGRHLVEPGPGAHQRRLREGRGAVHRPLDEGLTEAPVRLGSKRRALVAAANPEQEAGALPAKGDALVRVDDEGRGLGEPLKGNGAVMNFERRRGLTGTSTPASRPTIPVHAPAARMTVWASRAPAAVSTPSTRAPLRRTPTTSHPVRISTPSSRARAAIAVVTR